MNLLTTGQKIGNALVIVDIVKKGNPEVRPAWAMKPKKITIHNTGNSGRGAGAKSHNTYIHNLASKDPRDTTHVSWHLTVDDKFIYQHLPFNENAWHCGDGSGVKSGNRTSIGIEICENPDMDYKRAEENAIALTVHLMKAFGLMPADVVPHQAWSGKYCPRVILSRDGTFTPFRERITKAYKSNSVDTTKEVPKLHKPSSGSLRKFEIEFLKKALDDGLVTDKDWLRQLEEGTILESDWSALKLLIQEKRAGRA